MSAGILCDCVAREGVANSFRWWQVTVAFSCLLAVSADLRTLKLQWACQVTMGSSGVHNSLNNKYIYQNS